MVITELVWRDDRVAHIGRHRVRPEEVEEVCFGSSLVLRSKAEGPNPVYHVLGQTDAGRYLLCVVILFPDGRGIAPSGPRERLDTMFRASLTQGEKPSVRVLAAEMNRMTRAQILRLELRYGDHARLKVGKRRL